MNCLEGSDTILIFVKSTSFQNDINEFVYNNIEWEPGFSQQKGSLGCLLDGMGNSFDQSDLLVKLLRQAGFTANFVLGTIKLTEAELMAWFGTSDIWGSAAYCGNENIPYQSPVWNGSGWDMVLSHMWVEVVISGTTYVMDPSRKTYSRTAPVSGLDTIIGYTPATFLSNAQSGATVTTDYVQNMNTANIHSDLTNMTSNLTTWIKANKPDATVDDILGGQAIVPVTLPITFATSLSYQEPGSTPTIWTGNIPLAYQTTLQVQFPDNSGGWCIDQTFTSDQLAGTRLTLTYNGSLQPVLKLDGVTVATGIAQGAGTWNSILLTVTHNGYPVNWYDQQWWQQFIYADQYYLIGNAWGNLGRAQANLHQRKIMEYSAVTSPVKEQVVSEQLAYIWYTWAAQASRVTDLVNRIMNCHSMVNHQVGIVYITYDSVSDRTHAGVDIGGVNGSSTNLNNDVTKTPINDTVTAMHGVALEAATLAQFTGLNPGVSTTTVIAAANTAGSKIYKGTTANWNTGANISAALVTAGYSSSDMNDIYNNYLQWGYTTMLADNPALTLGDWTGWGDWFFPNSGAFGLINGSSKGGKTQFCNGFLDQMRCVTVGGSDGKGTEDPTPPVTNQNGQATSSDPVGLVSGDFFYNHLDIAVGSQGFPYGIGFERTYSSGNLYKNDTLGFGWSHNHVITAKVGSDGFLAMGDQFALQGCASIAELYVSTDLLSDTARPVEKLVVANLSHNWWIERLVNNTVVVSSSGDGKVFVKQPNGTYTAPAAAPGSLTLVSGNYKLTTPRGVQFNFNSSGQITTFVTPSGVTVTYSYTGGLLSSVSNGMGRTLTFGYTSGKLTSVTDGNSRTVNYSYDLDGNMTSDGTNSYTWDAENRLIKITYPGSGNFTEILYDASGIKGQITETVASTLISTKQFVNSGTHICEERDATSAVVKKFLGRGQTISGSTYFYFFEHLSSIRDMTDSSGVVQARYEYDLYGRRTKLSGALDSDFQYAGYYMHGPSGLNLTVYRAYYTKLARWLNRDPIEEAGGPNLFAYVRNNPILLTDPTGLVAKGPWNDCNRKCPDGSPPVVVTRAAWGSFYICRGDSIITPGRDDFEPALDNGYTIARQESQEATDARHAEDLGKFTGLGKDIQNAAAEMNRRQEQRRQEEQAAFWRNLRKILGL